MSFGAATLSSYDATTPLPLPRSCSKDHSHGSFLAVEVDSLLQRGAVEPVPTPLQDTGFYSNYFFVPRKTGGWRPILDLRCLNGYIWKPKFRMVMLLAIISFSNEGMWFMTLDMQDAYFHIDIHATHRQFLRFMVGPWHFRYRVRPFGLIISS